jgi:hypothetical protein
MQNLQLINVKAASLLSHASNVLTVVLIVFNTFSDLIIELKVSKAFLLRLLALFALSKMFYIDLDFGRTTFIIVGSHYFTYSVAGLDDRKVWNKVDVFVCLNVSLLNSDFWRLMLESFLLENWRNDGWFENLRSFLRFFVYGWLYLLPFFAFSQDS